jgi:hypothetical protein
MGGSACHDRREILTGLVCGFAGGFQQLPGVFLRVALLEYGAACDQDLSTGAHNVRHGVVVEAAVHLHAKLQAARLPDSREQLNFSHGRVDEGLATKPQVHAHDKDMVNERKNLIDDVDRGAGVYDHSGLAPVGREEAMRTIKMDASFLVDRDPIGSGFSERRVNSSGRSIIRWQSSGTRETLRRDATTAGPIVILGTKWPSMMSTWRTVAPPWTAASAPSRAKSAERIDGASSII